MTGEELTRAVLAGFGGPWPLTGLAADLDQLLLAPGMLFGARAAWWPGGRRKAAHEGLDLCCYRDSGGRQCWLTAGAGVAALLNGRLAALLPDFLGQTVVLDHGELAGTGNHLFTLYAHLQGDCGRARGQSLAAGEALGSIAAPAAASRVLPHLHLSVLLADPALPASMVDWPALLAAPVHFLDPLPLLAIQHQLLAGWTAEGWKLEQKTSLFCQTDKNC